VRTETDERLVARARLGSRGAAAELFERHWRDAWRVAYAITRRRESADDVAQDAFVSALTSLAGFNGKSSFRTWLNRIVVNRALNLKRDESRMRFSVSEPKRAWGGDESEQDPELESALRALGDDRRVPLVLRYWLDCSPTEIAHLLELPLGTVHSRLARGLADLRAHLEVDHVPHR